MNFTSLPYELKFVGQSSTTKILNICSNTVPVKWGVIEYKNINIINFSLYLYRNFTRWSRKLPFGSLELSMVTCRYNEMWAQSQSNSYCSQPTDTINTNNSVHPSLIYVLTMNFMQSNVNSKVKETLTFKFNCLQCSINRIPIGEISCFFF